MRLKRNSRDLSVALNKNILKGFLNLNCLFSMYLAKPYVIRLLYVAIGVLFFLYVFSRSILVGVTYDEAVTIELSNGYSFGESAVRLILTANNHLINTFFIKVIYWAGFDSLFLFRLPNVILFLFYQYFCYRIVSRCLNGYSGVLCFFILSCNLFLLDFFGIARGYGMSIAFMMGALCFGIESLSSPSVGRSIKSLIFGALSVVSIYSMIYFWCALFLVLHLVPLVRKDFEGFEKLVFRSFWVGGGLLLIVAPPIALLRWRKELYFGGNSGFFQDTVLSLVKYSFYSPELMPIYYILSSVFILGVAVVSIWSLFFKFKILSPRFFVVSVILLVIMGVSVAHGVLGILYPIARSALFFYPLAVLALFLCMEFFSRSVRNGISIILFCVSFFVFCKNMNFYKTVRWGFDSRTEEVLSEVNKQGEAIGRVVNFGFQSPLEVSMEYYLQRKRYPFVNVIPSDGHTVPHGLDYYLYISRRPELDVNQQEYTSKVKESLDRYSKDVFLEYPKDHIIVFRVLSEP